MRNKPSNAIIDTWIALLRAHKSRLEIVEQAFKQHGLPPLSWYDVLWELERNPADGLRPFELEQRILMPQYGLSRLLTRLLKAGYIERNPNPDDGRGYDMKITRAGLTVRKKMWPVYAAALNRAVGDKLTAAEAKQLAALLQKLS